MGVGWYLTCNSGLTVKQSVNRQNSVTQFAESAKPYLSYYLFIYNYIYLWVWQRGVWPDHFSGNFILYLKDEFTPHCLCQPIKAPRSEAQRPAQSRPHPLGQSHSEIGKCSSNPRFEIRGRRFQSLCWRELALETRNLGSGKVAGKVLIVDHM